MGIGQTPTNIASEADILCPMVYPSHYRSGEYHISNPNQRAVPYRAAFRQRCAAGAPRLPRCALRPWLQDFSLYGVTYGPTQVKAQIEALSALGVHQYLLWNARCRYTEAALTP